MDNMLYLSFIVVEFIFFASFQRLLVEVLLLVEELQEIVLELLV